jgi:carboxyl-terminal processing protease
MKSIDLNNSLLLIIVLTVLTFVPSIAYSVDVPFTEEQRYLKLFEIIYKKVKREYVEEVSDKQLIENALTGMLSGLDSHSTYLNEKDLKNIRASLRGSEFSGLGMEVVMEFGFLKVIAPYEDSPAFRAGIHPGDYILKVNGESIKGLSAMEIVETKLKGPLGTKIKLTIQRDSTREQKEVELTREIIKTNEVKGKLVGEDIVYIRVRSFSHKLSSHIEQEYRKLLTAFKNHNPGRPIKGFILDLRWNPGGLVEQAKEVTDLFLKKGMIVSSKSRYGVEEVFRAVGRDILEGLPMIVLINGGSASASEIVAGALQDHKRAVIVGTKSFGKGSIQNISEITPSSGIKITTARFYTPNGKPIQAEGITPDVVVEDAMVMPILNRLEGRNEASLKNHTKSELLNSTSAAKDPKSSIVIPTNRYGDASKDFQLQRAIEVVKMLDFYRESPLGTN